MAERHTLSEARDAAAREEQASRDLGEYRQTAKEWMRGAGEEAAAQIKFDFLPEPKFLSRDNIFADKKERAAVVQALENLRDRLGEQAKYSAEQYISAGGVGRLLEDARKGQLRRSIDQFRGMRTHDAGRAFQEGASVRYSSSTQEPLTKVMRALENNSAQRLKSDDPGFVREHQGLLPGSLDLSNLEVQQRLRPYEREALVAWPPRLFTMVEQFLGELTALRKPEKLERSGRHARSIELDPQLPVDPLRAGLEKGMFDFSPDSFDALRKQLEGMQGAYPQALVARLDTQAKKYGLRWTGRRYDAERKASS